MIISVEFKKGVVEVEVVSGMTDSELKELPHFAQALLSTKVISDDITRRFELLKAFTEDVLGKDYIEDTCRAYKALIAFIENIGSNHSCTNLEKAGDFDGETIDNGKYSNIKPIKISLKHENNNAYYKNNIDTKNIIDTNTQAILENKHSIIDTIIPLYKECENEKHRYKKYSQMLNILKDIRADEYISDNDRTLIDAKIKVCEEKISGLKAVYEKLMKVISEV